MLIGGIVGLVASLVGTLPLVLAKDRGPQHKVTAVMGATAARVGIAIVLALALGLSGIWAIEPLLIWVAVSHLGLLVVDTAYAKSHLRAARA